MIRPKFIMFGKTNNNRNNENVFTVLGRLTKDVCDTIEDVFFTATVTLFF